MTNASPADDDRVRDVDAEVPDADTPDATFEIEHGGQVYALPAALKGGFLRQADYTRKTQELAAHRRALLAERAAVAHHAEAVASAGHDRIQLAALDHQLQGMANVDWQAFAAQDPQAAQSLWSRAQAMGQARAGLAQAVAQRAERDRLHAARQKAHGMAVTGQALAREIEGWSPELAARLVDYARGHGVTLEELGAADDPRVWKIIHCAYQGDCAKQKDDAAAATAKAQTVRPAIVVSGGAATGGGVRDDLATKEWMKRRNEQMRKGR
ncbi:MAG: hypothetical protein JSR98_00500 [Proteobacteria bacterium]|nr:hypothetical protein [Pseudomonadota bacterium]